MSILDRFAEKVAAISSTKVAHTFILLMIITLGVILALGTMPQFASYREIFGMIGNGILSIFVLELSVKIILLRGRFFKSYWNVIDLIIVVSSLIPSSFSLTFVVLRLFGVMSFLEVVPRTKHIVDGLVHAIPGIINVLVVAFIFFFIFSLIGSIVFGPYLHEFYGTIGHAMLTQVKIVTGGLDWTLLSFKLAAHGLTSTPFFIATYIVNYFILALAIGAVLTAVLRVEEQVEPRKGTLDIRKELIKIQKDLQELKGTSKKKRK
jgi:voltage-gated sodium channel